MIISPDSTKHAVAKENQQSCADVVLGSIVMQAIEYAHQLSLLPSNLFE
jgi:lipase chaperone LimK